MFPVHKMFKYSSMRHILPRLRFVFVVSNMFHCEIFGFFGWRLRAQQVNHETMQCDSLLFWDNGAVIQKLRARKHSTWPSSVTCPHEHMPPPGSPINTFSLAGGVGILARLRAEKPLCNEARVSIGFTRLCREKKFFGRKATSFLGHAVV